jgi:hypothetical protein
VIDHCALRSASPVTSSRVPADEGEMEGRELFSRQKMSHLVSSRGDSADSGEKTTLTSSLSPSGRSGRGGTTASVHVALGQSSCDAVRSRSSSRRQGRCSAPPRVFNKLLRELFKPCVPVRGHRGRSGVPIAVEGGIDRQAAGGLSLCRIGKPENQVV